MHQNLDQARDQAIEIRLEKPRENDPKEKYYCKLNFCIYYYYHNFTVRFTVKQFIKCRVINWLAIHAEGLLMYCANSWNKVFS